PGSSLRHLTRKSTSREHSGQSRPGLPLPPGMGVGLFERLVVVVEVAGAGASAGWRCSARRRCLPLQELRRVLRAFVARPAVAYRALGGVAADLALQGDDVGENVGLAAQFVG